MYDTFYALIRYRLLVYFFHCLLIPRTALSASSTVTAYLGGVLPGLGVKGSPVVAVLVRLGSARMALPLTMEDTRGSSGLGDSRRS